MVLCAKRRRSSIPRILCAIEPLEQRQMLSAVNEYVSPAGNDSTGTGTLAKPYLTLQKAVNVAAGVGPGTTVIAEAGTYAGFRSGLNGQPNLIGAAGNPFTIEADPNAAAGTVIIGTKNAYTTDCIRLDNCSYVVINGFKMTNDGTVATAGVHVNTSDHCTVSNNNISGMGEWGVFTGFADYFSCLNNICDNSIGQHGIYISNTCTGAMVVGNTCDGNAACGIHFNGDVSTGGIGIADHATIENNIISNNGTTGGSGLDCDGLQYSLIQNNLFYNNHASGIFLYTGDASAGSINDVIVNNTFVTAPNGRYAVNIAENSTGCTVFNNIILGVNSLHGDINIDAASLSGFTSDYNVFAGYFTNDGNNSSFLNLPQWQSATGQDSHSHTSTAAALFVNPSANDYRLKTTAPASPAIGAGIGTFSGQSAPTTDLAGNPRPSNGFYDVGAYQTMGASTATLSGRIFEDINSDGAFTAGADSGFSAVSVYLDLNNHGSFVAGDPTTTTDALGNYSFAGLSPGLTGSVKVNPSPANFVESNAPATGFTTSAGSSATVNVAFFPTLFTGTSGNDTYTAGASGSNLNIVGGGLTYIAPQSLIPSLTFNLAGGNDSLTIDQTSGNPFPTGGITYDGGAGTDALSFILPAGNNSISVDATHVLVNGSSVTYTTAESIAISTGSGNDTLTQTAQPGNGAALSFAGGTGSDALIISAGTYAMPADPSTHGTSSLAITVGGGASAASITFAGSTAAGSGTIPYHLAALNVSSNGTATLTAPSSGASADRTVLSTNALSVTTGKLDIRSNSVDVHYSAATPFPGIRASIVAGNITSGLDDAHHAVGYADGADGVVQGLSSHDILIRYTVLGDANLDGSVNFTDLLALAQSYGNSNSRWDTGDFNNDGTTNFTDLLTLAQNYNTNVPAQGAQPFSKALARANRIAGKKH